MFHAVTSVLSTGFCDLLQLLLVNLSKGFLCHCLAIEIINSSQSEIRPVLRKLFNTGMSSHLFTLLPQIPALLIYQKTIPTWSDIFPATWKQVCLCLSRSKTVTDSCFFEVLHLIDFDWHISEDQISKTYPLRVLKSF